MNFESPATESATSSIEKLKSKLDQGLTTAEAKELLSKYGSNSIISEKRNSILLMFLQQFNSPMVWLLFAAAGLSFFFKEWLDGWAILAVNIVNALIGFYMEYQARQSMNALKHLTSMPAKVIRDHKLQEIPSEDLVPGDVLYVEAGDMIMADARIYHYMQLETDESALTGESLPVSKNNSELPKDVPLADRTNMLFKGTFVTKGNSKAIVTGTGMNTEFGKIAELVQTATQAGTPLEKKLQKFSKKLILITIVLVILISLAGLFQNEGWIKTLEVSIALAVAAIPEGLPIVATLALAQGMLKMARHKVIVKKLAAVETLGGTNVICTDKTGTLTENKIEVNAIYIPQGKAEIIYKNNKVEVPNEISESPNFRLINECSALCNTANLEFKEGKSVEVGDPLEVGLLKYASFAGIEVDSIRKKLPKVREQAFSSETKTMGTLNKAGDSHTVFAKGAVEELIKLCNFILVNGETKKFEDQDKKQWIAKGEELASQGLKLLGFAHKEKASAEDNFMHDLSFLGILGLLDPARKDVPKAIEECKSAGIKVIMITGDHPETAKNIGLKLGLINEGEEQVVHGKDMKEYASLSEEDKKQWLDTKIFARVTPKQKLDLVTLLQEKKSIVGMTGDGVNDAPALKKADIGIAMGQRGTQVAQEVSDMILKDDSFSSIVVAIKEGRIIFENIKKFVTYLLSCNMSELFIVATAALFNFHFALVPIQILFINLVTDVLPALALGVSEGNPFIMKNKPRNPESEIISNKRWIAIASYAFVISICVLSAVIFSHAIFHKTEGWNPSICNNILFYTLVFSQLWHVFNMASTKVSFFKSEIMRNKYVWYALGFCLIIVLLAYFIPIVQKALNLHEIGVYDWLISISFSLLSLLIIQALKRSKVIM
jgi:P-type Ca2+ transporter type 2C